MSTKPESKQWMADKLGFLVSIQENDLVLVLDQEFIETCGTGSWGPLVRQRYPGPYRRLIMDVGRCKTLISTVFAEMLHLRDLYMEITSDGVYLLNPSQRMLTVMDLMQIRDLFPTLTQQ